MDPTPTALVRDPTSTEPRWWRFERPREVISVDHPEALLPALSQIESATAGGLFGVGFLAYEAAVAFDPALEVRSEAPLPLLWFGLFEAPRTVDAPRDRGSGPELDWTSTITSDEHARRIEAVREGIAAGSTYQVNLTHRLRARFDGDPLALMQRLYRAQPTPYAAYLDIGPHVIASASPELFFAPWQPHRQSADEGNGTAGTHLRGERSPRPIAR